MPFEIQVVHAGKQVAASATSADATSCFSPATVAAAKLVAATQIELLRQKWYLLQKQVPAAKYYWTLLQTTVCCHKYNRCWKKNI